MSSRSIDLLTPSCKEKFLIMSDLAMREGLIFLRDWIVTCTARLTKEQIALYAQGRESLATVNKYRALAKMPPITAAENKHKVTWTLQSKHLIDLDDGIKENDLARAFDIAITKNNKAVWDLKVNVDNDELPDYEELAICGKKAGLNPGFFWKKQDAPHYEDIV